MTTNFIRMHLSTDNLEQFVSDVRVYDAKKLWDAIKAHFMAKTMENAASAMDKYFDISFDKGDMDKSITALRHAYRNLCEVAAAKFGKNGLTAMAIVFALRKLPSSFATFCTLQFKEFKEFKEGDVIEMEPFLGALEMEVRRQRESLPQVPSSSTALAVSSSHNSSDAPKKKSQRNQCRDGKHHPDAPHPESECFQVHSDKVIAYYQAAIDKLSGKLSSKANLGSTGDLRDAIVLDSGASGHFLKHKTYFVAFSPTSSSVFGANGAAIPILGFGPAVIQTATGPLELSLAYYAPNLSNSLVSLTHFIWLGYSLIPASNGRRFECRKGADLIFM
ncbi:hypothetical protein PTTG_30733, partial [Puccinia triticina 1-1 BBBD Race 1]|uniref:Retrovirus-related Pol polyprotein from transposon TNT 1-94-like beta-barrel domain-containing protein n=2 Tax=Puccinia triticina (isolate 1-1 / race 1 (BBBD)) TaxID=630390 RepID=A0ABL7D7F7_PUCT1